MNTNKVALSSSLVMMSTLSVSEGFVSTQYACIFLQYSVKRHTNPGEPSTFFTFYSCKQAITIFHNLSHNALQTCRSPDGATFYSCKQPITIFHNLSHNALQTCRSPDGARCGHKFEERVSFFQMFKQSASCYLSMKLFHSQD